MNEFASRLAIAGAFGFAAIAAPSGAIADVVGTAGAANVRSTGTPPGGGQRTIEIGTQVVHNEKIETSASGSLHIIFIDKTTLNIGPASTLIIDDFVFNPATGTGRMTATLARGVMRIVGGQVTHTGGAEIRTPAATIGVRGGVATIRHCAASGPNCSQPGTRAINHFGVLTAASRGGVETISRPGFGTFISGGSQPPSSPGRVSQGEIDSNNQQLTSQGGARGGTGRAPTDGQAANAGLGGANSGAQPLNVNPNGRTGNPQTGPAANSNALTFQAAQQTAVTNVSNTTELRAADSSALKSARSFVLTTTAGAGSKVPFLTASFVGSGNFNVSPVYGYKTAGSSLTSLMQASMGISGSGPNQTSFLSVLTGLTGQPSGSGPYGMGGVFEATSSQNSGIAPSHASGFVTSTDGTGAVQTVPVDGGGVPNGSFNVSSNDLRQDPSGNLIGATSSAYQSGANAQTYNFVQTFSPGVAPAGLGGDRPTQTLYGYSSALFAPTTFDATGAAKYAGPMFIASNSAGQQSAVSISMYADGRLSANFTLDSYFPGPTGLATPNIGDSASFLFGNNPDASRPETTAAYIDSRIFAARGQNRTSGGPTSTIGGLPLSQDGLLMVSSDAVNAASLFPDVKFCACDYTRWGFWSANPSLGGATSAGVLGYSTHIGTWVAGLPSSPADMPTVGTATYNGHVIATISQGTSQYVAAGNLTSTVNFANGNASINVANLDGFQYAGTQTGTPGGVPTTFQFALAGTALAGAPAGVIPVMSGNGGFFKSASSPVGSIAGAVYLNSVGRTPYLGAGIFAAQK